VFASSLVQIGHGTNIVYCDPEHHLGGDPALDRRRCNRWPSTDASGGANGQEVRLSIPQTFYGSLIEFDVTLPLTACETDGFSGVRMVPEYLAKVTS
jgi:hypothetical protein